MGHRTHLAWIIWPVIPFILGFVLLQLLGDGTIDVLSRTLDAESFYATNPDLRVFNGMIVYGAVGLFHVCSCAAVIGYLGTKILAKDDTLRRKTLGVLLASVLVLLLVNVLARHEAFLTPLNLSYRSICSVLVEAAAASHILPESCTESRLSLLAWFAVLPYLFGLIAAAFASALVSTAHEEADIEQRIGAVDLAFQATAFVMVTSTITLMLFYRLPLTIVADDTSRELIAGFAQGMALFWGIVFTLTLLAIFGPSNLLFGRMMEHGHDLRDDLRDRIGQQTMRNQASKILTMLAPLMVGSSASILDMITRSL